MSGVANAVGKVAGVVAAGALIVGAFATGNPGLAALAAKIGSIATAASPAAVTGLPIPRKPPSGLAVMRPVCGSPPMIWPLVARGFTRSATTTSAALHR